MVNLSSFTLPPLLCIYLYAASKMGYYRCAVLMCRNNSSKERSSFEKNIKYFPFPVNSDLRIKWIVACQRIEEWTPESSYICSEHFAETDFERDLNAELLKLPPKRILKPEGTD